MDNEEIIRRMEKRDIRPTVNRILVFRALATAMEPASLNDLETAIASMDKSSISRVLRLFGSSGMTHTLEDGGGIRRYELCEGELQCPHTDLHPHFYCEVCHQTLCLKSSALPRIALPEGYTLHSANYIIKGVCPRCQNKKATR